MVLGVKVWALAHLLANNTLADLLLFGGFLAWAVAELHRRAQARQRRRRGLPARPRRPAPWRWWSSGLAAWAGFAFWAHAAWIGVRPFG